MGYESTFARLEAIDEYEINQSLRPQKIALRKKKIETETAIENIRKQAAQSEADFNASVSALGSLLTGKAGVRALVECGYTDDQIQAFRLARLKQIYPDLPEPAGEPKPAGAVTEEEEG